MAMPESSEVSQAFACLDIIRGDLAFNMKQFFLVFLFDKLIQSIVFFVQNKLKNICIGVTYLMYQV